jgi:tetratricopeptide (TPR) repeat protein
LQDAITIAQVAGDKRILGYSLELFYTASQFITTPGAEEAALEGFTIFMEEYDDKWGLSMAYQNMARIAANRGDTMKRDQYFAKFKELVQEAPLSIQAGLFYLGTGMNERTLGHYDSAKTYFEEGLVVFRNLRNLNFELIMTSELGHVARQTGKYAEAKKIYKETLPGWQNLGNRGAIANQLECFAFLAIQEEDPQRAAFLLGAAEILREKSQSPMTDSEQNEYRGFVHQLHSMLTENDLHTFWEEGRSTTTERAVQFAMELE